MVHAVEPGPLFIIRIHDVPGGVGVSVWVNMTSFALENSTHLSRDLMSMGLSFQRLMGSVFLFRKRFSCSSSLTENQYLMRMVSELTSIRSNSGHERKNSR